MTTPFLHPEFAGKTVEQVASSLRDDLYQALDSALDFSNLQVCGSKTIAYVLTITLLPSGAAETHIEFVMTREKDHGPVDDCQCTATNGDLRASCESIENHLTLECKNLLGPNTTASFKVEEYSL